MQTLTRAIVAFAALLLFASGCTEQSRHAPAVPGNPAPAFALTDVEGKRFSLGDLAGSVVVLDFWATWCDPCRKSMPEFEELSRQYRDRKVVVLGISVDKGADAGEKVRSFAAREKLTYRMAVDDGTVAKAYGIVRVPGTVVLDRGHIIRETYPGYRPGLGKEIAADVEKLLK